MSFCTRRRVNHVRSIRHTVTKSFALGLISVTVQNEFGIKTFFRTLGGNHPIEHATSIPAQNHTGSTHPSGPDGKVSVLWETKASAGPGACMSLIRVGMCKQLGLQSSSTAGTGRPGQDWRFRKANSCRSSSIPGRSATKLICQISPRRHRRWEASWSPRQSETIRQVSAIPSPAQSLFLSLKVWASVEI